MALIQTKVQGGLGLISIKFQTFAMAALIIMWATIDCDHTLKHIQLSAKIGDLSEKVGGIRDFLWLVSNVASKPKGESALWTNFCKAYNVLKKNVVPRQPANWYARKKLPLWSPHHMHRNKRKMGSTMVKQREL